MPLKGRLAVRVNDGHTDRMVSHYCRGLRFTKVAPGGYQNLSFQMVLPRDTFHDLGPQDRVYVTDQRTAAPVIDGYLENPTPVDGRDGQSFSVSAMGGMALANDEARALIYLDRASDGWGPGGANPASGTAEWSQVPAGISGGVPALVTGFSPGQPIGTDYRVTMQYVFNNTDMEFGHATIGLVSGKTDSGYETEFTFYDGSFGSFIYGGTITTTTQVSAPTVGDPAWTGFGLPTGGISLIAVDLRRIGGATNVADDDTWTAWPQANLSVHGRLKDRYGAWVVGSGLSYIFSYQVVEDLLGRLLTMCDPTTAHVHATGFPIDQLTYRDGAKAVDVLNDLGTYEPDALWEILETLPNGKHRFNYRAWPTAPRYEVSVKDGWVQKGSDVDLCNRVLVTYKDPSGNTQTIAVTAADLGLSVPALGSRVKDAEPVTLPDGQGSLANAQQIGAAVLREKINPPKAGTITVRRPIIDHLTGNEVWPWELEAGYICRVRETGDDLRVTQVDYDDDTVSTVLTLGEPTLTRDQRLIRLARTA